MGMIKSVGETRESFFFAVPVPPELRERASTWMRDNVGLGAMTLVADEARFRSGRIADTFAAALGDGWSAPEGGDG